MRQFVAATQPWFLIYQNDLAPKFKNAGGGPSALTDGILGDEDYRKGFWQGFEKNSLETEIDLGQEQAVAQVQARFLQDANSWIFLPVQVEFWVAGADRKFSGPYVQRHQVPLLQGAPMVQVFTQQVPAKKVRYVKMKATNVGVCPPGHPGEGGAAFLMADEVIVQ
ncbi:MAG: hypothetical protein ACO1OQ_04435 [Rufibacter sp.]